ncbi:MAG: glycosyltransferase family 4 protein [Nanoarchaeota archaeon]
MKVLMFGWEFPPFNKGGLGTACLGLTKGLANHGIDVSFVIPKAPKGIRHQHVHLDLMVANNIQSVQGEESTISFQEVNTLLAPYITEEEYLTRFASMKKSGLREVDQDDDEEVYGCNLYEEVVRYANKASMIARNKDFDVIHAHDWMTYKAGISAKHYTGKPLVVHIHATEFDRTGGNGVNQMVYDIEREGFHAADRILAVSNLTKNTVVRHYGVPEEKVEVVHNAVEFPSERVQCQSRISETDKIVLFLGRITLQKGPDYFVEAARKVLDFQPDTTFVVAGSGDMEGRMMQRAAELGMSDKMLFTGFLRGPEIDKAYAMADLYVMPSVSEPFGITPLESMRNGTPVLISKQSGVSEVVTHALRCDFWDINEMTNKILAVTSHDSLRQDLSENGEKEVHTFTWDVPAHKCVQAYKQVLSAPSITIR